MEKENTSNSEDSSTRTDCSGLTPTKCKGVVVKHADLIGAATAEATDW
jgi:hypothetical protein